MRITEAQLRRVVRKIVTEQIDATEPVSDDLWDDAESFQSAFDVHNT